MHSSASAHDFVCFFPLGMSSILFRAWVMLQGCGEIFKINRKWLNGASFIFFYVFYCQTGYVDVKFGLLPFLIVNLFVSCLFLARFSVIWVRHQMLRKI